LKSVRTVSSRRQRFPRHGRSKEYYRDRAWFP